MAVKTKTKRRTKTVKPASRKEEIWLLQDADGCWWCGNSTWRGQLRSPMFLGMVALAEIAGVTLGGAKETVSHIEYSAGFSLRGPLKCVRFVRADDE